MGHPRARGSGAHQKRRTALPTSQGLWTEGAAEDLRRVHEGGPRARLSFRYLPPKEDPSDTVPPPETLIISSLVIAKGTGAEKVRS